MQSGSSGGGKTWKWWFKLIPSYLKQSKNRYLSRHPKPDKYKNISRDSIRGCE